LKEKTRGFARPLMSLSDPERGWQAGKPRQSGTTGKSPKSLSIPSHENIPLVPSGKSAA
jgi:hypothetical protein